MRNFKERAIAIALHRLRIFWLVAAASLAASAWWVLRPPAQAASASDEHEAHHTGEARDVDEAHGTGDAHDHGHHHPGAADGPMAQTTVWDERFEIFAEYPLPVAGEPAEFIVHVTDRQTFRPRTEGPATFSLRQGGVVRATHVEPAPARLE